MSEISMSAYLRILQYQSSRKLLGLRQLNRRLQMVTGNQCFNRDDEFEIVHLLIPYQEVKSRTKLGNLNKNISVLQYKVAAEWKDCIDISLKFP